MNKFKIIGLPLHDVCRQLKHVQFRFGGARLGGFKQPK